MVESDRNDARREQMRIDLEKLWLVRRQTSLERSSSTSASRDI